MKMKRKIFLITLAVLAAGFFFLIRKPTGLVDNADNIRWGVAFSKPFATEMGLDWREVYLAILDDLGAKRIRLPIYWQDVEVEQGKYNFDDYNWMIEEAKKRDVQLILVVGRKLPRWPECHAPFWADKLSENEKQEKILATMSKEVERYKDIENLYLWQVDNEPFLPFGKCTISNADFLDREIATVKN